MAKETVTVVYGEEKYFPIVANGFTVGPYTYTTEIREGEAPGQAIERAFKTLQKHADKMFLAKRNKFMERLETIKR